LANILGATRGGGIVYRPDGLIDFRYAWGLGNATNNQAEALALLQGICLLKQKRIAHARIIGDSQSLIGIMVKKYPRTMPPLRK